MFTFNIYQKYLLIHKAFVKSKNQLVTDGNSRLPIDMQIVLNRFTDVWPDFS